MLISLKKIYKDYYKGDMSVPVLKDINLDVEKGDYLAIMGPSGPGKSTLMNILGCLDTPTKGNYDFDGKNILLMNDRELAKLRNSSIGFVFQRFNLLNEETALQNVMLPLRYSDVPAARRRDKAMEALKTVGLEDRANFKPMQLSGGQCQRVAIARAIVTNPSLLLADEPTGALDTKSGEQIMGIFDELNRRGVTVIMITHEEHIAGFARKVMYLLDGELSGSMNGYSKGGDAG